MAQKKFELSVSDDDPDVAYLALPGHPGRGVPRAVAKQVRLLTLLQYVGPDIHLDLDADGHLIGIEFV
jgi:uncharacterized protein YuzE